MQREKYEEELKEQLENGEISEAQYKTLVSTPTQNEMVAVNPNMFNVPTEYVMSKSVINIDYNKMPVLINLRRNSEMTPE